MPSNIIYNYLKAMQRAGLQAQYNQMSLQQICYPWEVPSILNETCKVLQNVPEYTSEAIRTADEYLVIPIMIFAIFAIIIVLFGKDRTINNQDPLQ